MKALLLIGASLLAAPVLASAQDCAPLEAPPDRLADLAAAVEAALPGASTRAETRALTRARDALAARGAPFASRTDAFRAAAKHLDRLPDGPFLSPFLVAYAQLRTDLEGEVADLQEVFLILPGAGSERAKARIAALAARADQALAAGRVARAAADLHRAARATERAREPKFELFGGPLRVLNVNVEILSDVPLNRPVVVQFSDLVDPASVGADTVQVRRGPNFAVQAPGSYEVRGPFVVFRPRLPSLPDLSDAGFQGNTDYRLVIPGIPATATVLRDDGKPLSRTYVASFHTAVDPNFLFAASEFLDAPPPRVVCTLPADSLPVDPWTHPGGAEDVPTGAIPRVVMNRVPLLPASAAPPAVELVVTSLRGVPSSTRIPGRVVIEQDPSRVVLSFVPAVPLPDRSRFALRIDRSVTDLSGGFELADHEGRAAIHVQAANELVTNPGSPLATFAVDHPMEIDPRTFLVFTTRDEAAADLDRTLAFDGTDADIDGGVGVDPARTNASFDGVVPGAVAGAVVAAGGDGHLGELAPKQSIVLDTDSPESPGGVFHYQRIRIPFGVTVRVRGSRPAVIRCREDVLVEGRITVDGGDGEKAEDVLGSADLPVRVGGFGGAGGGAGGGSYSGPEYGMRGASGLDAPDGGGFGGQGGGEAAGTALYSYGGGGGGGGHATAGEGGLDGNWSPSYPEYTGPGGAAGAAGGILPSSEATSDGRDFAGTGGGGGGAGGNGHLVFGSVNQRTSGAGGGGGGGGVLISSAGNIRFSGLGTAVGGQGGPRVGNGGPSGAPGGGGAGGALALFAAGDLDVTGATFLVHGGAAGSNTASGAIGQAGKGANGFIRLEDGDGSPTGLASATVTMAAATVGLFDPSSLATDEPSLFTGTWFLLPAFQPEVLPFVDADLPQALIPGSEIRWEIQMADDSPVEPGRPDLATVHPVTGESSNPDRATGWVLLKDAAGIKDVAVALNGRGFQHFRIRVSFQLPDGVRGGDPVPSVDGFRLRLRHQD